MIDSVSCSKLLQAYYVLAFRQADSFYLCRLRSAGGAFAIVAGWSGEVPGM